MWNRHVEDIQLNIQELIANPGERCYWWALVSKASIVFHIKNWRMEMKLPLPRLVPVRESGWNSCTIAYFCPHCKKFQCTGKGPCTECGGDIDWSKRQEYKGKVNWT